LAVMLEVGMSKGGSSHQRAQKDGEQNGLAHRYKSCFVCCA